MISIRFHGRGGHGMKTASRILGSAAFIAGRHAQDSPIYGAERRGAAVAAFTRVSDAPILERGVIAHPDVIVVADETLLEDPAAQVLAGQQSASVVFLNAELEAAARLRNKIAGRLETLDVSKVTAETLGSRAALSAGLGAAAAKLIGGIGKPELRQAIEQELRHLGIDAATIERNQQVAEQVFAAAPVVAIQPTAAPAKDQVHTLAAESPFRSTPSILAPGNAELRNTGTWRVERPEIDYSLCTRCGICFVRCPDGAISLDQQGYPQIDYDHCKGCMICWDQCPIEGAVTRQREVESW